jgi:Domain of unknown function DUF29
MATRIERTVDRLHDKDFYAWSQQQAELLREGRFSDLDLPHLIEEVEDLGESLYRSVRSRVRTIIEHLLKLEHSPAAEPRNGWREGIRTQRADLDEDLTASLRPHRSRAATLVRESTTRCCRNAGRLWRSARREQVARILPLHAGSDRRRLVAQDPRSQPIQSPMITPTAKNSQCSAVRVFR